jgi:predicted transcriptional regulator
VKKRNEYTVEMAEEVGEALRTGERTYKQIAADMSKRYKMKINTSGVAYLRKMHLELKKMSEAADRERRYVFGNMELGSVEAKETVNAMVDAAKALQFEKQADEKDRKAEWLGFIERTFDMKHLDSKSKCQLVLRFMELNHADDR